MIVFSRMENRSGACPAPYRKSNTFVTFPGFARSDSVAARMLGLRLAPAALCSHKSGAASQGIRIAPINEALKARFKAITLEAVECAVLSAFHFRPAGESPLRTAETTARRPNELPGRLPPVRNGESGL